MQVKVQLLHPWKVDVLLLSSNACFVQAEHKDSGFASPWRLAADHQLSDLYIYTADNYTDLKTECSAVRTIGEVHWKNCTQITTSG